MKILHPTFSVIIANFQSGPKLRLTVAPILSGAFQDIELIVIDSASADESLRDAVEFVQTERDRVRLVSQKDAGIYDAMNHGVRLARGRYVLFMGAGDILRPGALGEIAVNLPTHERGLVYGDVMMGSTRYGGIFDPARLGRENICHQAIFYGRDVFRAVGVYNPRYRVIADFEFNIRCFADRRIEKKHVDVIVSDYEGGGFSANVRDTYFEADVPVIYGRAFGMIYLKRTFGWGLTRYARHQVGRLAFWRRA